jgi:hypothetical protein
VDRFGPLDLLEGGWLLLSSDGLHGVLPEGEMAKVLTEEGAPEEAAVRLVEAALERNTQDNVSAVLVHRPATRPLDRGRRTKPRDLGPDILVTRSRRKGFEKQRILLAVLVSLIVIPLLVGLILAVNWALSAGNG